MALNSCLVMKFLASDLTVREQSWRRGRSLCECWVRLGRRWCSTCWGLTRMFSNRVSSASSASCDAVGPVSWYRLSRTARRTCASIRPLSDEVAKPHRADIANKTIQRINIESTKFCRVFQIPQIYTVSHMLTWCSGCSGPVGRVSDS